MQSNRLPLPKGCAAGRKKYLNKLIPVAGFEGRDSKET
jgi:hypothetical protein